jgi:hypothetical protein
MNREISKCVAVVRPNNIGSGALNVLRYDSDVDEHNLKISTFESLFGENSKYFKKHKKAHEHLFTGNVHNFAVRNEIFSNQTLRPVGFFRKIPKGIFVSVIPSQCCTVMAPVSVSCLQRWQRS